MRDLSWNKLKPYIIQILLFVVIGVVGWFGVGFLNTKIQEKKDRIQELLVLTENRQRQMNELPNLDKQYAFILENEKTLDIILTKERFVDFIRILEKIAEETGVEVEIASRDNTLIESKITLPEKTPEGAKAPAPAVETGGAAEAAKKGAKKEVGILAELPLSKFFRLTITVTGTYPEIVNYLHKMETLPVALDVIGLEFDEHLVTERQSTVVESGVNPFNPDGTPLPVVPLPSAEEFLLDAKFDTVVYLKNL